MSILIDQNKRVIVQGITGREGSVRARLMLEYGTNIVGGVQTARLYNARAQENAAAGVREPVLGLDV